jgi:hypothetical protein
MKRSRKVRRQVGDIVAVQLSEGRTAFGWVLAEPLLAFFDYFARGSAPAVEDLVKEPIAFRIWVMNRAVTDGLWPIVGHVPPSPEALEAPWFFKQDPISRAVSILRTGTEEIPATKEQTQGLERAAVWDPRHVVDRLEDHFAGRPNKWVESMKFRS